MRPPLSRATTAILLVAITPLGSLAQSLDPLTLATNSLAAKPPTAQIHRPEPGAVPPGNNFTQGVPGDDYELTVAFVTPMTTGEFGGYDTFLTIDPASAAPGARTISSVYAQVSTHYADRSGDRYILGDHARPFYVGAVEGGIDQGFVHIFDFEVQGSRVELHGQPSDYQLVPVQGAWAGTSLLRVGAGQPDLVAHFHDRSLTRLDAAPFAYLGSSSSAALTAPSAGGIQIGAGNANLVLDVETDGRGGVYIIGSTRDDLRASVPGAVGEGRLFLAKYVDGRAVWFRQFGSPAGTLDFTFDFEVAWPEILVGGRYLSDVRGGQKDAFVTRFDAETGAQVATAVWDDTGTQFAANILSDGAGNLYTTGIGIDETIPEGQEHPQDPYIEKRRVADLGVVRRRIYGAGSTNKEPWGGLAFIPDGSGVPGAGTVYSAGWTMEGFNAPAGSGNGAGNRNAWLSAFSVDLELLWVEEWSSAGANADWPWDMVADADGNLLVVGVTFGAMGGVAFGRGDGFISKIDPRRPAGQRVLWSRNIGTSDSDEIRRVRISDGRIHVVGHTYGAFPGFVSRGGSDAWVAELDRDGQILRLQQFGTPFDERAHLAVDADHVHVGGATEGSLAGANGGFVDGYLLSLGRDLAMPPPFNADQFDLSGGWFEPETSGQGLMLDVLDSGARGPGSKPYLFGGWFTYSDTAGGVEQQAWYTLEGEGTPGSNVYALQIGRTAAGAFDVAVPVAPTRVGSATLRFESCTQATLDYAFDASAGGRSGQVRLQRLLTNVSCEAGTRTANAPRSFLSSGGWYVPGMDGQGLLLEFNPTQPTLFGAWYTYAPAGAAPGLRWFSLQAPSVGVSQTRFDAVPMYANTGARFDTPGAPTLAPVGSADLELSGDCRQITLNFRFSAGELAGRSGTQRLQRLGPVPVECVP